MACMHMFGSIVHAHVVVGLGIYYISQSIVNAIASSTVPVYIYSYNIGTHRVSINLKPFYPRLNWDTDGPHSRSQVLVIIILLSVAFNYLCGLLVLHTMHGNLASTERSYTVPHMCIHCAACTPAWL